jgi:hypothetical protein
MSKRLAVLSSVVWVLAAGCEGGASSGWGGTIDTLSNGALLVSNPVTGTWSPADAWTLTEDLRIGAVDGGMASFSQITSLAADAAGRVYVLDRQYQEIRVFDSLGTYVRTVGRSGAGPGEFGLAYGMDFDSAGRLWVIDGRNPRYSVFDTSGTYITSFRREVTRRGFMWEGGFLHSGDLYDYTGVTVGEDRKGALVRYDTSGVFVDTLVLPEYIPDFYEFRSARGVGMMAVPYATSLHWNIDPTGHVWAGMTDAYRLHRMTMEGDTTGALERAFTPVSVTAAERDSVLETVREFAAGAAFDESKVPDVKPAFQRFAVDDAGYVWAMASLPSATGGTQFDVFEPDGHYLGNVRTDVGIGLYVPLLIQRDAMYTVVTDELDVPYVVRLRIDGRLPADPD